jgi:hypothetical protein
VVQQPWQAQQAALQRQLRRVQQLLGNSSRHPDVHGLPAGATSALQEAAEQLQDAMSDLQAHMARYAAELDASKAAAQQILERQVGGRPALRPGRPAGLASHTMACRWARADG